ncbi:MAG: hypothetical protein FWE31_05065 [Firmicutes bacterium]|nr:hypothetical protein [Bacillota bacterium]
MKRFGVLVTALILLLAVTLPVAFIDFGKEELPTAHAFTVPDHPDDWDAGAANVANFSALNVYYSDNYRRQSLSQQTDHRLMTTGRISRSGSWAGITSYGAGFDGIVGVTGTFTLLLQRRDLDLPATGAFVTVEFAPPRGQGSDPFVWTNRNITAQRVQESTVPTFQFSIPYTNVGTYRVTIVTNSDGDAETHTNVYWIFVRNRLRNEGENNQWRIEARIGGSSSQNFNVINVHPLRATTWNLDIWQSLNVPGTAVRFAGTELYVLGTRVDNLSIVDSNNREVLNNPTDSYNLFHAIRGGNAEERQDRIVISVRSTTQVIDGQVITTPIVIPNGQFRVRARVLIAIDTMTADGVAVPTQHSSEILERRITFGDAPSGRGFPWLTLVISFLVLAVLGGGILGANWLIRNSQTNQSLKLSRKARQIAETEEKNYDQLRQNLNDEFEDETMRYALYQEAGRIVDDLEKEEQGDIGGVKK